MCVGVCVAYLLYIFNLCERVTVAAAAAIALQLMFDTKCACLLAYMHMVTSSSYHLIHGNTAISLMRVYQFVVGICFFSFFFFFCVVRCSMLHLSLYIHHICM